MSPFTSSSQFTQEDSIKQRDSLSPPYAPPVAYVNVVGGVRRDSQYDSRQHRALESPTAFSIPERQHPAHSGSTTMPPPKRSTSNDSNGTPAKQIKTEHPEEFSNAVKKRLQSSSRTGQACDRCKIRKIRCDGLPGGCSPCLQNNTECRTTDRITGRATSRGYVEGLEQRNRDMQLRIQELEHRLARNGSDIKTTNGYQNANYEYTQALSSVQRPSYNPATEYPQNENALSTQQQETNMFRALPTFRAGCTGDNYLGVSPGNSNLSSIKGTALSILGMEIDIADFDSVDMDEPDASVFQPQLYNKSYQAFLQTALNINLRIDKVDLPSRSDGLMYAQWYFRLINPYLPLLHKATFMKLLTRVYDDRSFQPTVAETVMVHMVFAIMFFQYAARNWEDAAQHTSLNNQSNLHYHYSLGMFYQLSCSHTVQDVQALTLICAHLRNFPKPGASWMLAQTTMALAVELGLHRSSKRWAPDAMPNALDVEMRKRTFWGLLAIHVTLSGKLGRPMPFRMEDFDVEIPEPVDDDLLSENGLDTSRPGKCLHAIGLQAWRMLPLYMEMYSTIYAVRRHPYTYLSEVNTLEAKLRTWKDGIPADLAKGEGGENDQEGRVFALYAQVWALEFRLLLRHPSVSLTNDTAFNTESMRVCVESSRQMLSVVRQLQKFKSLDTTWYNSAVYVMAITTTLFAQWDKRNEISAADLAALREEMDIWLDIMGDVGSLLGSGSRLREAVRVVTDGTLGLLSRSLPSKPQPGYVKLEETKSSHQNSNSHTNNTFSSPAQNYAFDNNAANGNSTNPSTYIPPDGHLTHQPTSYPAATQYSTFPDNSNPSTITYTPQESYTSYPPASDVEAPLLAAFAAQASQVSPNNWHRSNSHSQPVYSGSSAWHQWTTTMTGNLGPNLDSQDCYSANALMQLGGRDLGSGSSAQTNVSIAEMTANAAVLDHSHLPAANIPVQWPMNIFDS